MIRFSLPYPVSANRYWATRIVKPKSGPAFVSTYVTAEAKKYKELAGWLAKGAGVRSPLQGPISIVVVLHAKRNKDPRNPEPGVCIDLDNCLKITIDALKGVCLVDDAQVRRIHAERGQAIPNGGLDVIIEPMEAREGLFA